MIADEIYSGFVFEGNAFYPMASLTTEVPVLSVGGLAKKWLVPGWRLGWILVHDRNGAFKEIHEGLLNLSQIILGPNSLVQASLRDILHNTPSSFYDETIAQVEVCILWSGPPAFIDRTLEKYKFEHGSPFQD